MKKVWKGWVPSDAKPAELFEWDRTIHELSLGRCVVEMTKGRKRDWDWASWPPKRVTITVEVED